MNNVYMVDYNNLCEFLDSLLGEYSVESEMLFSLFASKESEIARLKNEIELLVEGNKVLRSEVDGMHEQLVELHKLHFKNVATDIRGTVWRLECDDDARGVVVQTDMNEYHVIDLDSHNRWYNEPFTKENIIEALVEKGWRLQKDNK